MRNYLVIWCFSSSLTHDFLSLKVDLLGDDLSAPSEPVVAVPGGHKTNEDLLAEIFGGSTATSPATPTPASQPQKSTANDILSLFDSPAPSAPPQAAPTTTTTSSLFDLASSVTPSAPPPKPTAAPKLPSYTAYDKNGLVISLTPQRSTTQVVDILARFQVKGNAAATNLNFQVAVPKVSTASCLRRGSLTVVLSDFYYYYCHRRNSCKCSPCRVRTSNLGQQRRSKCASPRRWV